MDWLTGLAVVALLAILVFALTRPAQRRGSRELRSERPDTPVSAEPDAPAKPLYLDENVQFTVYRPTRVQPAKWYPLLAFAHLAEAPTPDELDPVQQVQQIARQTLGEDAKTYAELRHYSAAPVPRDGDLTFLPEVAGVEFDPPRRSFLWLESVHREDFQLRASGELSGRIARGQLSVFLGSIVLAEVPIVFEVGSPQPEADHHAQDACHGKDRTFEG